MPWKKTKKVVRICHQLIKRERRTSQWLNTSAPKKTRWMHSDNVKRIVLVFMLYLPQFLYLNARSRVSKMYCYSQHTTDYSTRTTGRKGKRGGHVLVSETDCTSVSNDGNKISSSRRHSRCLLGCVDATSLIRLSGDCLKYPKDHIVEITTYFVESDIVGWAKVVCGCSRSKWTEMLI